MFNIVTLWTWTSIIFLNKQASLIVDLYAYILHYGRIDYINAHNFFFVNLIYDENVQESGITCIRHITLG